MLWWKVMLNSEAPLSLLILILFLEVGPGSVLSLGLHDEEVSQSRMAWCKETNTCAGCDPKNRPRCLGSGELLLGADLCGCCYSCVGIRDLGESCGSQLSVWPDDVLDAGTVTLVTILATTWCREGLVCLNFVCGNVKSTSSSWLKTDEEFIQPKEDHDASTVSEQHVTGVDTAESVNDDENHLKVVSLTSITPTSSSTPFLAELREQRTREKQPCYAKNEETMTISSYPSDDMLGRFTTMTIRDKRFGLVFTGNLLTELEVLLNLVDRWHEDSMLDEGVADSLIDRFSDSLSHPNNAMIFLAEDHVQVPTPSNIDSKKTATLPTPQNFIFPGLIKKRELQTEEDDRAGLNPPQNIQEMLIRGASAHKEYIDEARGQVPNANTLNRSAIWMPREALNQGDESTVRVQITTHPRKVQTLIDLEDNEEVEETEDEENQDLQLADRGSVKDIGKLSPFADERGGISPTISRPFSTTVRTKENAVTKKTAKSRTTDILQGVNSSWNETLKTFDGRLALVEDRVSLIERVLEEMARWCNLGIFSITRDCLVPQNSDIHLGQWGSEHDEHLALASGIDAVKFTGNRRKLMNGNTPWRDGGRIPDKETPRMSTAQELGYRRPYDSRNQNFFRTMIIDDGSPRRRPASGYPGPGRLAGKTPCRSRGNRGSSWRELIANAMSDPPAHRTVQRSVSTTYPFRSSSSGKDRDQVGSQLFGQLQPLILQETQIPVPATSLQKFVKVDDLEIRNTSHREDEGWVSSSKKRTSSVIPSWKIFIVDEKKVKNEEQQPPIPKRSPAEVLLGKVFPQRDWGRRKRSVNRVDGIISSLDRLRRIRAGLSSGTFRRARNLFERELSANKGTGFDVSRNPLIDKIAAARIRDFQVAPTTMGSKLLFKNSDIFEQTTESIPLIISMDSEDVQKFQDTSAPPYFITSHGNSTIRIEEINNAEYEENLPEIQGFVDSEDDFDHIYESLEAEVVDGDFDYNVAYDEVEYVDGSSVEIVTETPVRLEGTKSTDLKLEVDSSEDKISRVFHRQERNRRNLRIENDQCESERPVKRELPLLLFGSSGKREPKTIVWPSKWAGYRRDKLQMAGSGSGKQGTTTMDSRFQKTGVLPVTTTPTLPARTTESLIMGNRLRDESETYIVTPKISGLERRGRKNRRKLVWR